MPSVLSQDHTAFLHRKLWNFTCMFQFSPLKEAQIIEPNRHLTSAHKLRRMHSVRVENKNF